MSSGSGQPSAKSEHNSTTPATSGQHSTASAESGQRTTQAGHQSSQASGSEHHTTNTARLEHHDTASEQHTTRPQPPICGGIGGSQPVSEEDLKIWDMYKAPLEKKIQQKFHVPTTHKLKPVQVSTQVVAGVNYFFKVELPNKKYANARVYHVPWQADTHGKEEHVDVSEKLLDNPTENVGHF